ncbi:MAG: zinc-ribbon domain-containing protein [Myxococcales bacterium]|nr:zinc-ribbon domain-containing protein [Myxococcales bacterium]
MALKVQCSSCGAPYNIDERRIPAAGLKVRCPKCTTTFVVKKPEAEGAEPPPPTLPASPAVIASAAAGQPPGGSSMAAVPRNAPVAPEASSLPPAVTKTAPTGTHADDDLPAPAGSGLPAPAHRPPPPRAKGAVLKGTQLGLGNLVPGLLGDAAKPGAAPADLPAERLKTPSPADRLATPAVAAELPATRGGHDLPALPATRAPQDLPAARAALPPTVRGGGPPKPPPPAAPAPPAAAAPPVDDFPAPRGQDDFPAARTTAGVPGVPARGDLPAPRAGVAHLPATRPAVPTAPVPGADLPAARARPPAPTKGVGSFEIDLPMTPSKPSVSDLPAVSAPGVDLPAPRPKGPPSPGAFGELDLPSVGGMRDLPSVGGPRDLPSVGGPRDLPSVGGPRDLPSIGGPRDLPAVGGPRDLPSVSTSPRGTQDLPSPRAFGELDLPTVSPGGGGTHLPAMRPAGADLPDLAAHLPAIGSAREPSVVASDFGDLAMTPGPGDFGSAATQQGPGYTPGQLAARTAAGGFGDISNTGPLGLAAKAEPARDFGEIELPGASARPPKPAEAWGGGGGGGFGEIDLGGPPADPFGPSPRAATETAPAVTSDFGDLELPGPASPGAPSATYTGGPALSGFDSVRPPAPTDFGEASIATKSVATNPYADSRGEAGGMGFGEVDLGGGGGSVGTDDMEFGGLDQARMSGSDAPPPRTRRRSPAAQPRSGHAGRPRQEGQGRPRDRHPLRGPRGRRRAARAQPQARRVRSLRDLRQAERREARRPARERQAAHAGRARRGHGAACRPGGHRSAERPRAGAALPAAPRLRGLLAVRLAAAVRQGRRARLGRAPDARQAHRAEPRAPARRGRARRGRRAAPAARGVFKSLLAADAKNVDAALSLGALELKQAAWKDAIAAFEAAKKAQDSARARGGLVLAYEGNGDYDKAKKEATALAEKFKTSAVARVFLAQQAWLRDRDEKGAIKWLDEVTKPPVSTGAAPAELVAAFTLRGTIHLERGRVTDAMAAFKAAVDAGKGAQFAAPHYGLGEVFLANGQYPQAMAAYDAALQVQPTYTPAKIGKARALLKQEKALDAKNLLLPLKDPPFAGEIGFWLGQAEEKISKPAEAMKIYEAAIKAQPGEARPYVALANLQSKEGKVEDSDATLAQAVKSVPPSERLYLSIGDLRFRQERYKLAVEQFDKALELQPENVEVLFMKGRALLRMDKEHVEQGKAVLDQVEKKDAKYPGLALELGLYYQKTEQIEKALERYKAALEASPDDVDIELQVARAMVEARDKTAEERLRKVLEKCPKSASPDVCISEAKHFLGRALLQKGLYADAERYLKEAVDKADNNAQYHLYRAWALVELTRLPEADVELTRVLELDRSLGNAYWLKAEILLKSQDNAGAIREAQKALTMNPNRWEAYATMALAHKRLNQDQVAYKEYERAVGGDPQNPKAAFWRFQMLDILDHAGGVKGALTLAKDCVKYGAAIEPKPPWLAKARYFLGKALRGVDDAAAKKELIDFLNATTGTTEISRADAKAELAAMGAPYAGP